MGRRKRKGVVPVALAVALIGVGLLSTAMVAQTGVFDNVPVLSAMNLDADVDDDEDVVQVHMRPMGEATAPLEIFADGATTVYFAAPDAEIPDEYGDYTETASVIESETDGDVFTVDISDDRGEIDTSDIGPNQDFVPGETYTVWSNDGEDAYLEFHGEVTIPAETEAFKVENQISEQITLDTIEKEEYGDTIEEVRTAEGETASGDTEVDTGLPDRIEDIYDDGEFILWTEIEVDDGTALLGEVDSISVHDDVEEVSLTITVDGEEVYSESEDADDVSDLELEFVEDDMERNPVRASSEIVVEMDVEFDDDRESTDANVNLVEMTIVDLFGEVVYDVTVEG